VHAKKRKMRYGCAGIQQKHSAFIYFLHEKEQDVARRFFLVQNRTTTYQQNVLTHAILRLIKWLIYDDTHHDGANEITHDTTPFAY
jgi:hypothetical protein